MQSWCIDREMEPTQEGIARAGLPAPGKKRAAGIGSALKEKDTKPLAPLEKRQEIDLQLSLLSLAERVAQVSRGRAMGSTGRMIQGSGGIHSAAPRGLQTKPVRRPRHKRKNKGGREKSQRESSLTRKKGV